MKKVMDDTEIVSRSPKGLGRTKKAGAVPGAISSGPQAKRSAGNAGHTLLSLCFLNARTILGAESTSVMRGIVLNRQQ